MKSTVRTALIILLLIISSIAAPTTQTAQTAPSTGPSAQSINTDVGIIKGRNGCPANSEEVWIKMDNEDHRDASYTSGWTGGITWESGGNIRYRFCRVPGHNFPHLLSGTGSYSVLSLGNTCPNGSYRWSRHFDNENGSNANSYSAPSGLGDNIVSISGSYTLLVFCAFYDNVNNTTGPFPNYGVEYGVIGSIVPGTISYGVVGSDDEDNNNSNYYYHLSSGWGGRSSPYSSHITDESNTRIFTARVR